jgi:hypothetical protein
MAANSSAHPAVAGFNQSGGAYFITLAALVNVDGTTVANSFVHTLTAAGSNSGGAFVQPTLAPALMSAILPATTTATSAAAVVGVNKVIKDMGRTVVSAGRVFRKFAPVVNTGANSSFGVVGVAAAGANAGFGAFYLEVGREGASANPAPIARYF